MEVELYWNFLNDPVAGWGMGAGYRFEIPPTTAGVGENAWSYEPFVVVYKTWGNSAINFSASYELEDPIEADELLEHGCDGD